MPEELKFVASVQDNATAPLKKIGTGLQQLSDEAKKTDAQFQKTGNVFAAKLPEGIKTTTAALENVTPALKSVEKNLTTTVVESTKASGAITNVGSSLQKLTPVISQVDTGLGSMAAGFLEAGLAGLAVAGVGIALSLLSSYFEKNAAAAEAAAKATAEARKEYEAIVSPIAKEVGQVEVLVEAFKKENLTRKEKTNIIEQLQKISPAYFGQLDKEKTTVDELTKAYSSYSNAIIRSIELKIREGQLNKVIEERLALQDKGNKKTNIEIDANGKIIKSTNALFDVDKKGRQAQFNDLLLTADEQKRLNNLLLTEKQLTLDIANIKQPQDFHDPEKVVRDKKTIQDVLDTLGKELQFLGAKGLIFNTNESKAKIRELLSTAENLIKSFNVSPDNTVIGKLFGVDISFQGLLLKAKLLEGVQPQLISFADKVHEDIKAFLAKPIVAPVNVAVVPGKIDIQPLTVDLGEQLTAGLIDIAASAGAAFADTLAQAITSGSANVGDFFQGIFKSIGAGLKQLGQMFVKAGLEILIVKKALTSNPYLAIAAGLALEVLGGVLQNSFNKKQAFATGGLVGGTGTGDTVNALLTPGEFVMTRAAVSRIGVDNLAALNGGNSMATIGGNVNAGVQRIDGTLVSSIDGTVIRLALNRADARLSRIG